MQPKASIVCEFSRFAEVFERKYSSALRVLETQQSCSSEMDVIRLDDSRDFLEIQRTVGFEVQGLRLDRAQGRSPTSLVLVGVGLLTDDKLIASLAVRE